MPQDGDHFLASFNDTLTCGLGASFILLFVFVVLVTFDVPQDGPDRRDQAGLEIAGLAPPLSVTVKGYCPFIETLGHEVDATAFIDKYVDGRTQGDCTAHAFYPAGAIPDSFCSTVPAAGYVHVTAILGGRILEAESGSSFFDGSQDSSSDCQRRFTLRIDGNRLELDWGR